MKRNTLSLAAALIVTISSSANPEPFSTLPLHKKGTDRPPLSKATTSTALSYETEGTIATQTCSIVDFSPEQLNFPASSSTSLIVTVTTVGNCTNWTYSSSVSWLTVIKSANKLSVMAFPNTSPSSRSSIIYINGTKRVYVKQAAGCVSLPTIIATTSNSVCVSGAVTLGATTSSGTAEWYSAPTSGSLLATGASYTTPSLNTTTIYYVGANNGCISTSRTPVTATVKPLPSASISANRTTIPCVGMKATLTASGGVNYLWSTGATTPSITVTTQNQATFTVTVTGSNGCTASAQKTITAAPNHPEVDIAADRTTVTCANPTSKLTATYYGPVTSYLWSTGATTPSITVSPTANTTYSVTVNAVDGCVATPSKEIRMDVTPPTVSITPTRTTVTCTNPSTTLTATSSTQGVNYTWTDDREVQIGSGSQITVTPTSTSHSTYWVSAVGANGCPGSISQAITYDKAPPNASIAADRTTVTCINPSATLTASGGVGYLWSTGATTPSITVSPTTTTTYSVTVRGSNGCTTIATQAITADKTTLASISADRTTIPCVGMKATLTASGGVNYLWSTGATTPSITVTTQNQATFTVTVTGSNGCTASAQKTITAAPNHPEVDIAADRTTVTCANPTSKLTATYYGPVTSYLWSTGATTPSITVSPTANTTYTVTVNAVDGCVATPSKEIRMDVTPPTVSITPTRTTVTCTEGAMLIANSNVQGANYTWTRDREIFVGNGDRINVSPDVTTTYTVSTSGANGCSSEAGQRIYVDKVNSVNPTSIQASNVSLCYGETTTLTVGGGSLGTAAAWKWYAGSFGGLYLGTGSTISVSPTTTTTYFVRAEGDCNATDYVSTTVKVKIPSVVPSSISFSTNNVYPGTKITLSVVEGSLGENAVWKWYAGSCDGNSIGSGASIQVSPILTTTYFVRAESDCSFTSCVSKTLSIIDVKAYRPALPDNRKNYIQQITPQVEISSDNLGKVLKGEINAISLGDIEHSISYFDGLGRPMQTIAYHSSPSMKDIVQPIAYDDFGREKMKYLPYTGGYEGAFKFNAITDQLNFYANTSLTGLPAAESNSYSETVFEASPLNRILEQGSPGAPWQPLNDDIPESGHTQRVEYATNTASEVIRLEVNGNTLIHNEYYAVGSLYKTISKNENWQAADGTLNTTEEFKDKLGLVVLKRTYVKNDQGATVPVSTYYAYDDLNLLRYVIPPTAVSTITFPASQSSIVVQSLCYYYRYDGRKRMVEKQLPGAEPVYVVYDNRDRLVLTQDGNMRTSNQWLFTKYDMLNRPVITGIYTDNVNITPTQMQAAVDLLYNPPPPATARKYFVTRNNTGQTGYSDESFPTTTDGITDYLTATYYDSYGFPGVLAFNDANGMNISSYSDSEGTDTRYFEGLKGVVTGSRAKVFSSDIWLTATSYYDDRYRLIQSRRDLYDDSNNGKETTSTLYDFAGKVLQTKQRQEFGSNITTVGKYFTYDHAGRLLKTEQQIDGDANGRVTLAELAYNELGQLVTKKLHQTANQPPKQTVDYAYNIRGWLTNINNLDNVTYYPGADLFAMKILYNEKITIAGVETKDQFNGNISGVIVNRRDNNGSTSTTSGYGFTYDALNRITSSNYGEGASFAVNADRYSEFGITYDLNGNIKTLKRNSTAGLTDDLTYLYKNSGLSNQLLSVTDASDKILGFKDVAGDDYDYDLNGNLKKDLNKGVAAISYNTLNLPSVLSKDGSNGINYIYSATGEKLCKEVKVADVTSKRYYSGVFEYDNSKALALIHHEEGLVEVSGGANYSYGYFLKDHLGNTRVMFKPAGRGVEVLQVADYYPFGGRHIPASLGGANKYLYNGKELQDDLGLGVYDYGARFYDPILGRFMTIDPLAELHRRFTPYHYCANNPIRFIDPDGMDYTVTYQDDYTRQSWVVKTGGSDDEEEKPKDPPKKDQGNGTTTTPSNNNQSGSVDAITGADRVISEEERLKMELEEFIEKLNSEHRVIGGAGGLEMLGGPIGKIGSYAELVKLTKGLKGALQAHHLIEVRHLRRLLLSAKKAPAVILSRADHAAMSKTLQQLLPFGKTYTRTEIINAYKQAYSNSPEWVEIVVNYLF